MTAACTTLPGILMAGVCDRRVRIGEMDIAGESLGDVWQPGELRRVPTYEFLVGQLLIGTPFSTWWAHP